ncbi:MAG TPA: galactokinase family protein [Gemmatimonadales bacterium]
MTRWTERATTIGLSPAGAALAAQHFAAVETRFAESFGDTAGARAWWVPGRIEVLGKHTDYGGGRSLLCTVERGFHVVAAPRRDGVVCLADASTRSSLTASLDPATPQRPGHWSDYPISVIRRVARDFPGAATGMNAVFSSSLPSAAGLSSSSAFVIATFLPLASFNALSTRDEWRRTITSPDLLAEYLGAVENGRGFATFAADHGVGTQGGSEDQTAILRSIPGALLQYHFVPVTAEEVVTMPPGWVFAVAASGVHAAKGGAVQSRYNALAGEVAALLTHWHHHTGRDDHSLFAAMGSDPGAEDALLRALGETGIDRDGALRGRLRQFCDESMTIIPAVAGHLRRGDVLAIGSLVARSFDLARTTLRNQVAETDFLTRAATEAGAVAGSPFGAGFGGSVWALFPVDAANHGIQRWRAAYLERFPTRRLHADFFVSPPGPPAVELPPP